MTTRNTQRGALTDLQQAILDVLWSRADASADDVREALAPRYRLKDSSIRTLLRRLEARGYVRHRVDGKVFRYAPTLGQGRFAARAVRAIIDRFHAGSVEQFLVGMVDEKVLSAEELARLARKVKKSS